MSFGSPRGGGAGNGKTAFEIVDAAHEAAYPPHKGKECGKDVEESADNEIALAEETLLIIPVDDADGGKDKAGVVQTAEEDVIGMAGYMTVFEFGALYEGQDKGGDDGKVRQEYA